ncbi:uncharacterized protein J3R85_000204 [Psidium guajava]|nr:uncharacterized protein J3R85_000204 [Psidium guajava]
MPDRQTSASSREHRKNLGDGAQEKLETNLAERKNEAHNNWQEAAKSALPTAPAITLRTAKAQENDARIVATRGQRRGASERDREPNFGLINKSARSPQSQNLEHCSREPFFLKSFAILTSSIPKNEEKDNRRTRTFRCLGVDRSIYAHISRLKSRAELNRKFNKKNEETISSLMSQIQSMVDELKSEHDKDSQSLVELLQQSFGECENSIRNATAKFHELEEKFSEDKTSHQQAHLQALNDIFAEFEKEKERLFMLHEQIRKKEKSMISTIADKLARLDICLKIQKEIQEEFTGLVQTLCLVCL